MVTINQNCRKYNIVLTFNLSVLQRDSKTHRVICDKNLIFLDRHVIKHEWISIKTCTSFTGASRNTCSKNFRINFKVNVYDGILL